MLGYKELVAFSVCYQVACSACLYLDTKRKLKEAAPVSSFDEELLSPVIIMITK